MARVVGMRGQFLHASAYMNFNKHTVTPTFATSFIFDNFIPTYHSLHVCSCQALLCARLAACHVPLV